MPFSLNLTVNIKFVSLLCFEQMFTHLCLQKNIINVHHISSLLILTIWSKALYLLLRADKHEGCVVEEVGDSWCVYISIPETNFEGSKRDSNVRDYKLFSNAEKRYPYFSICLIKWLLSHNPARERKPHLVNNSRILGVRHSFLWFSSHLTKE